MVILGEQARIEQAASPEEIMARPANDAVRDFVGMDARTLRTVERDGETLVLDGGGNIKGVLR